MSDELSFSHYCEIIWFNENKINYIDKNIKTIYQDKTIGIILVKENNEFIIKYSSDNRIISRKYEIV